MQKYNKTTVAIVLGVIFVVLNQIGITEQSTVAELLQAIAIAVSVYAVPNKN